MKQKVQVFRKGELSYRDKGKGLLVMLPQHLFHPYYIPPSSQLIAALIKMGCLLIAHGLVEGDAWGIGKGDACIGIDDMLPL